MTVIERYQEIYVKKEIKKSKEKETKRQRISEKLKFLTLNFRYRGYKKTLVLAHEKNK